MNDPGPTGWQSTSRSAVSMPSLAPNVDLATAPTDIDLLQRYLAGDPAGFATLYDRHDRPCFDFIRRLIGRGDTALAEDLHQDVWLSVAKAAASFDAGKARFVTWLFTIARNRVMDCFRRSADIVHLMPSADADAEAEPGTESIVDRMPADPAAQPEHRAERGAMAQAILREVQRLPLAQREAFVLFSYDELSLQEIADVTGVGIETAKSRLRYARDTLRQRLADWRPHDV